jgi:hypothetical protein
MKTKTALVLTAAGVLLTGSAALAVNVQTLNGPPAGTTPANTVLLPQNSTTTPPHPASTPTASTVEDRSPASSPNPSTSDHRGNDDAAPSPATGGRTAAPSPAPAPAPAPSRASEPGDDHGGHGEPEPGDDKHSGNDD